MNPTDGRRKHTKAARNREMARRFWAGTSAVALATRYRVYLARVYHLVRRDKGGRS